ncbi:hypothetical protein R0135_12820 [Congregibacter variabilis]|uniref:Glycosyl transferase family 2 n=1 Tax=Congregibacter variabilis TaxID=3081200 RepID=A0ABZ0I0U7_9GAMM|nr:hypothetical protein R0135_12820 [Congregibacter sp. IMCC43200]
MSAIDKYLAQYAEPEARACLETTWSQSWEQVLVIPAYGESPEVLKNLSQYTNTLMILVINHPDTDANSQRNDALRDHLTTLVQQQRIPGANASLEQLPRGNHVLVVERPTALPAKEGVGLARKIGCDLALALFAKGQVQSPWIHCSDADARLPKDYFKAAKTAKLAVALTYPFTHLPPDDPREHTAIELYESYLQSYVEGLHRAGSLYAFHTIGSCIAVDAEAYAQVRGFPRRAAGEDFYLLNKLAKQGSVITPRCTPLSLSARLSNRVPFGTGPALTALLSQDSFADIAYFYDPRCYKALAVVLSYVERFGNPDLQANDFKQALEDHPEVFTALQHLGLEDFLAHAKNQCADTDAFVKQFHQWLDGFKTLKLIHALTEHWPKVTEAQARARIAKR